MNTGRKQILLVVIALLLTVVQAAACPGCTYQRMLETDWFQKTFILNLGAALAFTAHRLDLVRFLYTFIPYVVLHLWLNLLFLMRSFEIVESGIILYSAAWILGLNLVGAGLLFAMGRMRFYRRDKHRGLAVWQPVAYAATVFFGNIFLILR